MGSAGRPSFFRWASLSSFTPGAFTAECQPGPSTTKSPSLPRFFDQIGGYGGRERHGGIRGDATSLDRLVGVLPTGGVGADKKARGGGGQAGLDRAGNALAPRRR